MPLLKKAQTPAATATAPAPAEAAAPKSLAPKPATVGPTSVGTAIDASIKNLDNKDRKILLQGSYQAALHSMGSVQHGGKSFADYLAKVEEAAVSNVNFVLRNM